MHEQPLWIWSTKSSQNWWSSCQWVIKVCKQLTEPGWTRALWMLKCGERLLLSSPTMTAFSYPFLDTILRTLDHNKTRNELLKGSLPVKVYTSYFGLVHTSNGWVVFLLLPQTSFAAGGRPKSGCYAIFTKDPIPRNSNKKIVLMSFGFY